MYLNDPEVYKKHDYNGFKYCSPCDFRLFFVLSIYFALFAQLKGKHSLCEQRKIKQKDKNRIAKVFYSLYSLSF